MAWWARKPSARWVFHVVGMPSYQNQRLNKIVHHTLRDGNFGNFVGLSAAAACCSAIINPDNCVTSMERLIAEARRNNQPAYILVPSDYAQAPITPVEVRPVMLKSNEAALKKAIAAISERLKGAKSVVALPAFTVARLGLQKHLRDAIEALGCPFATTAMEKCLVLPLLPPGPLRRPAITDLVGVVRGAHFALLSLLTSLKD
jgi:indolepyruvate decarboxylase